MKPRKKKVQRRKAKQSRQTATLSTAKKRWFAALAVCIPVLLLLIAELLLRLFHYGGQTRLFVPTPDENSPYLGINREVSRRYFIQDDFWPTPRKDLILRNKPDDSYRIFVLGGSTTAGFPYGHNLSFPRILQRRLADTFPERRIEIMNTAMTAINTYSLLDFMDEILDQEPDAILIYAGHNEFYGALGVGSVESLGRRRGVILAYLELQRFKLFLLVRDAVHAIRNAFAGSRETVDTFDPMQTEMARIVKEKNIPLNHALYRTGEKQFESNLRAIVKKARNAGLPVLIGELVSNIRDQAPFVSVRSDTLPPADSVFRLARKQESAGAVDSARKLYYRAKDLDALRFRATEAFNGIIRNTAETYGCTVVPLQSRFEAKSPHGLIGGGLMHEHLHPNYDGYFLMADAFFEAMQREGMIEPAWPDERIRPSEGYARFWGFTPLDSTVAALTIRHLKGGWPFQKTGPNRSLETFDPQTPEDSLALDILLQRGNTLEMAHLQLAKTYESRGDIRRALMEYRSAIYSVPHLDLFYEPALKMLIDREYYTEALQLLSEGLKFNKSPFIHKWIGQCALILGQTRLGVLYLEKARPHIPDDTHLLYNLARGYYQLRMFHEGDQAAAELKSLVPAAEANRILMQFKQRMMDQIQ